MARMTDVRGVQYQPFYAWNSFQIWAERFYNPGVIERDLDFAKRLNINSIRIHLSYTNWYIQATMTGGPNQHLENLRHFLNACRARNLDVLVEIFEVPPKKPPTIDFRMAPYRDGTTYRDAGGVHDPPRWPIGLHNYSMNLQNWQGQWSPMHFVRRLANEFGDRDHVVWEIMNEPGDVDTRVAFVADMVRAFRQEKGQGPTLSVGCKAPRFNTVYEDATGGEIDVHQYHMNIVGGPAAAREQLFNAKTHSDEAGKPIWCTEVQRTLASERNGGPDRMMPNYKSLADHVHNAVDIGWIDGFHFWGLMMQPAYLRDMRERGRYNGIFFPGGEVFDLYDARAIARDPNLVLEERRIVPEVWADHPFPYPEPGPTSPRQCQGDGQCAGNDVCVSGVCVDPDRQRRRKQRKQATQAAGLAGLGLAAWRLGRNF